MSDHVVGLDLGTTLVKAGVFTPDGRCLSAFNAEYPTARAEGGRVEQDPADWCRLIDEALSQFREAGFLGAATRGALTSQVNTHVFVDKTGAPLMPAILWQDHRAVAEAAELDARVSDADKIKWLGAPIPIDASHLLARMLWVQRHRPEIWDQTAYVLLPKDFALLHLTGELATDPLSNIGLVGPSGTYVAPILELVDGAQARMVPIKGITEIAGTTSDGIEMATATMDGWVGLVGAGACRDGAFAYLSGTSEVLGAASAVATNEPGIVVFPEAEGIRVHAGPTQSGGASQQWFSDISNVSIPDLIDLVASRPRRMPTPLFLPHLAGERAPLWNPDLRGAFLGLDAGMVRADFMRAIYEGVACSARHVLDAIERSAGMVPDTLMCGGGGFRSDPWGQIRADILGKRLERLKLNEPAVVGAAVIALASGDAGGSIADMHAPFAQIERVWEPDPSKRTFFEDLFAIYLDAISSNEQIGKRLASLHQT